MARDKHHNQEDRILLSGVKAALTGLTVEELTSLRRFLSLSVRMVPVPVKRDEAMSFLTENAEKGETEAGEPDTDAVDQLVSTLIDYLDRSLERVENGLRTWLGIQVSMRLRELESEKQPDPEPDKGVRA